jgi:hypothetical protein
VRPLTGVVTPASPTSDPRDDAAYPRLPRALDTVTLKVQGLSTRAAGVSETSRDGVRRNVFARVTSSAPGLRAGIQA